MIRLVSVYKRPEAPEVLFKLMKERSPAINISHRRLPSMKDHLRFIRSKPYRSWDLIMSDGEAVGAVYLTRQSEIGLFMLKRWRGRGFGEKALKLLMKKYAGEARFLANINPRNRKSIHFFEKAGFRHIQNTYELRRQG